MKAKTAEVVGFDTANIINFETMYEKVLELFKDQGTLSPNSSAITLADIELSKAKANNFLDGVSNIITISHQLEIIAAEKDRFKRSDELKLLNMLRRICTQQASAAEKIMDIVTEKMEDLYDDFDNADPEQVALLNGILDASIDSIQKIIASSSRLIQLERFSGSRPWGKSSANSNPIAYIQGLDADGASGGDGEGGVGQRQYRRLSHEEVMPSVKSKNNRARYSDDD